MIKVLFLSPLYPNRYDAMLGLFVRKHAEAVSRYCKVKVLYMQPDKNIKEIEITTEKRSELTEIIVYYPIKEKGVLSKLIRYLKAYRIGYREIAKDGFKPDIIHANILTRSAFIAFVEKTFRKIPFVITEHWSRYLNHKTAFNGKADKWFTRKIVKNAAAVMPVSEILKQGMISNKLDNSNYIVVNNVVDDYFYTENTAVISSKKRILHVSCFDEKAKNVCGILRAIEHLSTFRNDFELIIIGTGVDYEMVYNYSKTLNIPKGTIQFLGEKTPEEVAGWFRNCDLFILFSNYETAGVVIAESLVSGVPVISTNVGIASEVIDSQSGKIIKIGAEDELTDAINYILENLDNYNRDGIKETYRNKFSYSVIGKKITDVYQNILNN